MSPDLDRRSFLKLVGGGIVVLVRLNPSKAFAQGAYPKDLNAYLHIDEDGRVTFFSGKIEMGQGVMTSQAQMAADELGVALDVGGDGPGRHRPVPVGRGDVGVAHHAHVRAGAARGGGRGARGPLRARRGEAGRPEGPSRGRRTGSCR